MIYIDNLFLLSALEKGVKLILILIQYIVCLIKEDDVTISVFGKTTYEFEN